MSNNISSSFNNFANSASQFFSELAKETNKFISDPSNSTFKVELGGALGTITFKTALVGLAVLTGVAACIAGTSIPGLILAGATVALLYTGISQSTPLHHKAQNLWNSLFS